MTRAYIAPRVAPCISESFVTIVNVDLTFAVSCLHILCIQQTQILRYFSLSFIVNVLLNSLDGWE
jgi:hypothetical protein